MTVTDESGIDLGLQIIDIGGRRYTVTMTYHNAPDEDPWVEYSWRSPEPPLDEVGIDAFEALLLEIAEGMV